MAISNTDILIKRSTTTSAPSLLKAGELAYSYQSNTAFIGTADGTGVLKIGGELYTAKIDAATPNATGSTLVERDASGNASFNYVFANIIGTIEGNANSATQLQTARNFSISGGDITASAISFNGTGDVILNASLDAVPSLGAGTYGSQTEIPVIQVAANGRVMNVTTSTISTTLNIDGDGGSNAAVNLLTDNLDLIGGSGITATASGTSVTFDVDTSVVRSNTPISIQTIDGSVEISGNLTVLGTQFITNTTSLNIADPLIYLAANNYFGDDVDIGFAGNYFDGSTNRHTGVFRNAGTKEYYIFDNYDKEISGNNEIDVADASFRVANLHANLISQQINVTNAYLTQANVSGDVGVLGNVYVSTDVNVGTNLIVSGATTLTGQANTTNDLGVGGNSYVTGSQYINTNLNVTGTTTLTGQANASSDLGVAGNTYLGGNLNVTGTATFGAINLGSGDLQVDVITANTVNLTNALTVPNGGTGATSFTSGRLIIGNGTDALQELSNSTFVLTGSGASNNTITGVTVDAWGRFTAATFSAISGLTVPQGGTGQSSFTQNGIIFGNNADGLQVTAAAGTADQSWSNQILTVNNSGVPVWTTALDGGTF